MGIETAGCVSCQMESILFSPEMPRHCPGLLFPLMLTRQSLKFVALLLMPGCIARRRACRVAWD
jgi:hypothetical protein